MSNYLAPYARCPLVGVPGFDHQTKPWVLRWRAAGWIAYRSTVDLVLERRGDNWTPRHFPSAAAAARYLEEHPEHD